MIVKTIVSRRVDSWRQGDQRRNTGEQRDMQRRNPGDQQRRSPVEQQRRNPAEQLRRNNNNEQMTKEPNTTQIK